MSQRYELAPWFAIRMAGVPYDILASLATSGTAARARELLAVERELDLAIALADAELRPLSPVLSRGLTKQLRRDLQKRAALSESALQLARSKAGHELPATTAYQAIAAGRASHHARLDELLRAELTASAHALVRHAASCLPAFAVFQSDTLLDKLRQLGDDRERDLLRSGERNDLRHIALYLQRLASKTDTFSEFGPVDWGRIAPTAEHIRLAPAPAIAARHAFVERWVARQLAALASMDPAVRALIAPRVHPAGTLEDETFFRHDLQQRLALTAGEREIVAACDGKTLPAALGSHEILDALAARGVLVWQLELVAMDPAPLDTLVADTAHWTDGEPARWAAQIRRVADAARAFASTTSIDDRRRCMQQIRDDIAALGGALAQRGRSLYAAGNPIGEWCVRRCNLQLDPSIAQAITDDIAPWLDLWRHTFSLAASYCFDTLAPVFADAPRHHGQVTLAAFLAHCERRGVQIRGNAMAQQAARAFEDVKQDLRAALAQRSTDDVEWKLSADELRDAMSRHPVARVDERSWPSADLQLAAPSLAAAQRGEGEWIVAELHHGGFLHQNAMYWQCPDRDGLRRWMTRMTGGRPLLAHSHGYMEFPTHAALQVFELPEAHFAGTERPDPAWSVIAPSRATVVIDAAARDVRVVSPDGRDLGSLVRTWILPMGFHPFFPLRLEPHSPRLRLGKTIVQRQSWTVRREELSVTATTGVSAELVLAVERLRAARGLPRWVFARPGEAALRRADFLARDKDIKPVYLDLESYFFLEMFAQRLAKFDELELSEMWPSPEQLCWREPDGARVFELRTLIGPHPQSGDGA